MNNSSFQNLFNAFVFMSCLLIGVWILVSIFGYGNQFSLGDSSYEEVGAPIVNETDPIIYDYMSDPEWKEE